MSVTIYHNPRCSKSRQALQLLQARALPLDVVDYLQNPPSADHLQRLARLLELPLQELLRTNEKDYQAEAARLSALDEPALAEWLAANPRCLQRPIVVTNRGARIGRPPERVLEIL